MKPKTVKLIKDKSGHFYKQLENGMLVKAGIDDIKKALITHDNPNPTPYIDLLKKSK